MFNILLATLIATVSAQISQCGLGLQFKLYFNFTEEANLTAVATALGWQKLPTENTYQSAALNQTVADIAAAVSGVGAGRVFAGGISGGSPGAGQTLYTYYSLLVALCDDTLSAPAIDTALAIETALLNAASALRTKNVMWSYFVRSSSLFSLPQFRFVLTWSGTGASVFGPGNAWQGEVRSALSAVANNSTLVRAPNTGGGMALAGMFYSVLFEIAIGEPNYDGVYANGTLAAVYDPIRTAILTNTSDLRTNNKYFKIWTSPSGPASPSPAPTTVGGGSPSPSSGNQAAPVCVLAAMIAAAFLYV